MDASEGYVSKSKNVSWDFFEDNLPGLCACAVMTRHIGEVSCAKSDNCLLRPPVRGSFLEVHDGDESIG
jgi:hypothetical protein